MKKKILFIGGSLNQTTIAHTVAKHLLNEYRCYFTPYYCDGYLRFIERTGWLDFTVIGGQARASTAAYLEENNLNIDYAGKAYQYDLVVTTSDLLIQRNIRNQRLVLIQEGMTDPENFMYYLVKWLKLPRYLASTSTTGLSNAFDRFCVASEGYKDFFVRKGVKADRMVVTGIPNFDNAAQYYQNDFPYKNYVLVATSDARETLKFDSRKRFIRKALDIAEGRQLVFKLHPNENAGRATREIKKLAPDALVFSEGNTCHMIANSDVLITQYSSVVYIGLALDKEVHSYYDLDMLKRLLPLQNGGTSGQEIARVCREQLERNRRNDAYKVRKTWSFPSKTPSFLQKSR